MSTMGVVAVFSVPQQRDPGGVQTIERNSDRPLLEQLLFRK